MNSAKLRFMKEIHVKEINSFKEHNELSREEELVRIRQMNYSQRIYLVEKRNKEKLSLSLMNCVSLLVAKSQIKSIKISILKCAWKN